MGTDFFRPLATAVSRLRGQTRRLTARTSDVPGRWPLGLAVLAVAALAVAYSLGGTTPPTGALIRGGARFSADDKRAIALTLDAKHIPFVVDQEGRVQVAAVKLDEANEAVAKLHVGPRRLDEIEKARAESWSLLDTTEEKQERSDRARDEWLAGLVRPLPGVVDARVTVNRPKPKRGFAPTPPASAFVYLETEADRELSHKTVKSIQILIAGAEPDVKPNAMTIVDRTGHSYLDSGDPSVGAQNRKRAFEEEFRDEIVEKLEWLKEAQVSVQLVSGPEPTAPPTVLAGPNPAARQEPPPARPCGGGEAPRAGLDEHQPAFGSDPRSTQSRPEPAPGGDGGGPTGGRG